MVEGVQISTEMLGVALQTVYVAVMNRGLGSMPADGCTLVLMITWLVLAWNRRIEPDSCTLSCLTFPATLLTAV
jgi:hypothetical protein